MKDGNADNYLVKIQGLQNKIKELERANLIYQEYFSMSSGLEIFPFKSSPFNGKPEFSDIFTFTIDLNLQKVIWLTPQINSILGFNGGKLFLKNTNYIISKLVYSADRKRFKKIIEEYTYNNLVSFQSIFRFKSNDREYCWVLLNFETTSYDQLQGKYLQIQTVKLSTSKDFLEYLNEFIKTSDKGEHYQRIEHLTGRQREVLVLLGKGLTSKEIANQLCISFHTVEAHRKSISKKTQIKKRAALISLAAEMGILR